MDWSYWISVNFPKLDKLLTWTKKKLQIESECFGSNQSQTQHQPMSPTLLIRIKRTVFLSGLHAKEKPFLLQPFQALKVTITQYIFFTMKL